jgi:calcitonin
LESSPDPTTLSEEEVRLLLSALVQDYVQMKAKELTQEQKQEAENSR